MPDVLDQLRRIPTAPMTQPEPLDRLRERVAKRRRRRHRLAVGGVLALIAVSGTIVLAGRGRDAPEQVTTEPGPRALWTRTGIVPPPTLPPYTGPVAAGSAILIAGGFQSGDVVALDAQSGNDMWHQVVGDTSFVLAANEHVALLAPETGEIIAVDIGTGEELWRFGVTAEEWPRAATISNDAVYFGTSFDFEGDTTSPIVYALDLTAGGQLWRTVLDPGADLEWAPPTVQDGLVLVADTPTHPDTATSQLHALDASTGAVRWKGDLRTDRQGFHTERPVLADGVVHTVSAAGEILSFDAADGTLLWFDALGATLPHVAGANNGLVYVAFSDGVRAFEQRTGQRAWELSKPVNVGLVLRGDTLYAVGGASLHAIDAATGSERWQQPQPGAGFVVVDSTLLLVSANEISAIEAASGQVLWSAAASGITTDPVVTNGVVVVGTSSGDLVAFALDDREASARIRVPDVRGLALADAQQSLGNVGLRSTPTDGDPTDPQAVVVAQEPPGGQSAGRGATVGLRTALIDERLCGALDKLPDFADGAHWDLPIDTLNEIAEHAGPELRGDVQRVIDHITSGEDTAEPAEARALDRLVIHRRACS